MNKLKPVYRLLIGTLALIFILGLCWTAIMVWVWSPAISARDLAKFHAGMTKDEVVAVMGEPKGVRTEKTGTETWVYARPLQWANFIVEFNTNGTVESYEHDE